MLRRLAVMSFAFVIAAGCGAVFLAIAALFDPAVREAGFDATMAGLFAMLDEAFEEGAPRDAFSALGFVLWAIVMATCVAPLALAALIGELAGARAWAWYAGASAVLAAASPWIARAARGLERAHLVNELEGRVALLFFLTGAVTGTVYWLIAARDRRARAPAPQPPARP
jgi:hypothetical protein